MPKYEKIWLAVGIGSLAVFLIVTGIMAVSMGLNPPNGMGTTIEPEKVETTVPFNRPGLEKIGPNEYRATIISYIFGYNPNTISIPKGATVHFQVTSKDVVHGFLIPGKITNLMLLPGHVVKYTQKFNEHGEFLFLCHEYCGIGHQEMYGRVIVKDKM
ncbi:cytochrome c oxidase subunit II [Bacillus methanolicus]|uniref:Cytochrome aa3 subunit 2 n=1 Tax=Bacillus methanolicus (strain MGA3 / ATCC 53907) TaxID=796606 RepID=I3E8V4_BACMM|nr:cytochrome c oxidase subunit II [Bacillus methanolicus]AIE60190.1 cytochrome c oxidase subunit II [Bacillus methanolicus MGA3]EIJ82925.1 cytochrome c oxidase subunit II [Bacillus methanolicus MGA3]